MMIKNTKFFRCPNLISRKKCYKSDHAVTTNLAPRNLYESQIFSTLKQFTGERIVEYNFGSASAAEISGDRTNFFAAQTADIFKTPKGSKIITYPPNATFECDLYMKIDKPEVLTVVELLQGAVIDLKKLNPVEDIKLAEHWLFIEVSLGPQFLAEKLWQLERAVRVFKTNDPLFNIGSCVVLHNGSKEESDDAIRKIILPNSMLISKVPVYVGWVPTRNIYSVLQGMESKMQSLQSDVQGMESKIDAKLQGMESKMDAKLQGMESKIDAKLQGMESKMDAKLQGMESKMDGKLQSLQSDVQDIKITLARLATLLVK